MALLAGFAGLVGAAPAPVAVAAPDLIAPPSGTDTGNSLCLKGFLASSCPGRWNEKDRSCCISDD
ncbi:uncharacterized protein ACLA_089050 [Aspergillus clavatus NRRL 1]|uniref:Uncharacterized protein n=1 Tax=Aspergillus clavatus (strain ATCC 1007 / CBS 513.65 / DSM 816 / NCTC 3887 / NRRL 1 / QM 1276 / 107) TaxID=344612 RepID=A1CEB4_ASPCL|nr:uncharacterized protein ACLA_089050 [Aspergillus clavatus NRRL 1]EAW11213.1 hypothetical protein ACLA_089050 [Aspergillus clavatus NRRL 1]